VRFGNRARTGSSTTAQEKPEHDLRKEEAKTALRKLIKVSDVLVQNFRAWNHRGDGFGYDVLKTLNPRMIMVNVSAYGQFRSGIAIIRSATTPSADHVRIAWYRRRRHAPIRRRRSIIDRTTALHSASHLAALS